jgi:dissimilatory sulfite reductase (desulfoviridin) alpha/beta subunit
LLSVIFIPSWFPNLPTTSTQLLVAGGALLFVAGLLMGFGKRQRVSLHRSLLTDELMIYLSRIADAVERHAERPTAQQIADMIERRIAEYQRNAEANATAAAVGASAAPKSRPVAFSMFGREYPEKS